MGLIYVTWVGTLCQIHVTDIFFLVCGLPVQFLVMSLDKQQFLNVVKQVDTFFSYGH